MGKRPFDRRVIMTKRFLKGSLIELLRKKTIHEITIKEICERADINRTTFYNHYDSQYELYSEIIEDVFLSVKDKMHEIYNDNTFTDNEVATEKFLTTVFEFAEENSDLFLVILGNNGSISIGKAFSKYIDIFILEKNPSQQLRYSLQFISAGVSNILWLWLNEKNRMPAEKIVKVISALYSHSEFKI